MAAKTTKPADAVEEAVDAAFAALPEPAPVPAPAASEPLMDLDVAMGRLSGMRRPNGKRVSAIAVSAFDQRELRAERLRDTWENYLARFNAFMQEPA